MNCSALYVPLPQHKLGDRWSGILAVGPWLINDAAPAANLSRVKCQFKKDNETFTFDSEAGADALLTITDPATWEATFPELNNFLPSIGIWKFDIEFYETGFTSPLTLAYGEVEVIQDITPN